MSLLGLLDLHARSRARWRASRLAGRVAILGTLLVAVALLLERMGLPLPWIRIPVSHPDRVVGFLVLSVAGLVQGAVLVALVLAAALAVRWLGVFPLNPGPRVTALEIDRRLDTDRFSAALEAAGPLAPLVARRAVEAPPPARILAGRRRRGRRLLLVGAMILVALVALMPGTAPGTEGPAPVAGEPDGGREERPLLLSLVGLKRTFQAGEPVPVQVLAEARDAPGRDLDLAVRLVVDDGEEIATARRLFLAAGAPGEDAVGFPDLLRFAGDLAPGDHRAVAHAGGAESNAYLFRIEAPAAGGPKPEPPPPDRPKPPPGQPGGGRKPDWRPKFVEPLVREGDKVEKRARVPVEDPHGGAPIERPLDEAWPELARRKEAALKRRGLSPAARKLVRVYFERLHPEEKR